MSEEIKCYRGPQTAKEAAIANYKENYEGEPLTWEVPIDAFMKGVNWEKLKVFELMKLAYEAGFKQADLVEAGLEGKETDENVRWIYTKNKL